MMDIGKKFYIIDTTHHFYKLDSKDKLVMARDSSEATLFSLQEANRRIGSGRKARFYNVLEADIQETELEAESAAAIDDYTASEPDNIITPTLFDTLHNDWESMLTNLCYMSDHMSEYQNNLSQMLSDVDKEICDIMHYLEFNDLTDAEMLKASKMLQDRRRHRREIKDEMDKTALMKSTFLDGTFGIKVQQSLEIMERMKDRQYTPRKLASLFQEQRGIA